MGRRDLTTERQATILDAAEHCIAKYGLRGATLEKIADEANINRGLIHHYVGNRDEVIEAIIERLLERYQSSFDQYIAHRPATSQAENLIGYYFDAWFDLAPDDDAIMLAFLAESERDSQIRQTLHRLYTHFQRAMAKELGQLYPNTSEEILNTISYSMMTLAFGHATFAWIKLPQASKADIRSVAANLVQTLS